jgi:hypothetical protein
MALSKAQLQAENSSSFPNNHTGYITPELLRNFNSDMIVSLVDENTYNADSASWNQQIALLDPSGSVPAILGLEQWSASAKLEISALEQTSQSLNEFTASQAVSNSYFATTGSNSFTGNQTIGKEYHINTNGIYWNDSTSGYNNLEIINSAFGNVDISAINGRVRIINSPLFLTGSALTSSNDISTSANIYAANLLSSAITASSLITASVSQSTITFTKGDGSQFNIVVADVSGSAGNFVTTASFNSYTASQDFKNTTFATTSSVNSLSASIYQTDATQSLNITINSQSAWGAFQSASAYSASSYQVDVSQSQQISASFATSSAYSASLAASITGSSANVTALSSSIYQTDATQSNNIATNTTNITTLTSKTGSYATTGSNSFTGSQSILSGSIAISNNGNVSSFSDTELNIETNNAPAAEFIVSFNQTASAAVISYDGATYDNELWTIADSAGIRMTDWDGGIGNISAIPFISLEANNGSQPAPQFGRGLGVTGSMYQSGTFYADQIDVSAGNIVETTGSYVGTFTSGGILTYDTYQNVATALQPYISGSGGNINTSSFATTGSNIFSGSQIIRSAGGAPLIVDHYDATPTQNTLIGFNKSGSAVWSIGNLGTDDSFVLYNPDTFQSPISVAQNNDVTFIGNLTASGNISSSTISGLGNTTLFSSSVNSRINAAGGAPQVQDEGTILGNATSFNFNGAGVTATITSGTASVTIPGGGGSINTGSFATTGSNTFVGNQIISGATYFQGDQFVSGNITVGNGYVTHLENTWVKALITTSSIKIGAGGLAATGSIYTTDDVIAKGNISASGNIYAANLLGYAITGSNNFVGDQNINGKLVVTGSITASNDILVNGINIGKGSNNLQYNTVIGTNALSYLGTAANYNTAIGYEALKNNSGGNANTAIGLQALLFNYSYGNTAIGNVAGANIENGHGNTIIGPYTGSSTLSNYIVLANGDGFPKLQYDGTNWQSTGSLFVSGNIYANNLTGSTIATGSFATTGSNNFVGNQTISGSLTISSSATTDVLIKGQLFITGGNYNSAGAVKLTLQGYNSSGADIEKIIMDGYQMQFNRSGSSIGGDFIASISPNGGYSVYDNINGPSGYLGLYSVEINGDTNGNGIGLTSNNSQIGGGNNNPALYTYDNNGNFVTLIEGQTTNNWTDGSITMITPVILNPQGAPTSPSPGTIYFSSADSHFYGWNGSAWKQLDNTI